jgi:hypothetical protein
VAPLIRDGLLAPPPPLDLAGYRECLERCRLRFPITFASDAHSPDRLAAGFAEAVRVADAAGFGAGNDPLGPWFAS